MSHIGINGFGRIGRMFFRAAIRAKADIRAINDPSLTPKYVSYLLKYDSTHGPFRGKICVDDNVLIVNGMRILILDKKSPKHMCWSDACVEYVVDCSGRFTTMEKAKLHLESGAKKVIISSSTEDIPMFVCGVNLDDYKPDMKIVSPASCTTNCLAPVAKILHENYEIKQALMTVVHATTARQTPIDGMSHKKWRLGRGAMQNIIPTTTEAAKTIDKILPALKGRITGMSFRVPVGDVSLIDLTALLGKPAKYEDIKRTMKQAACGPMKGILGYTEDEVVSSDFISDPHSAILDASAGIQLQDKFVKLITWYDNEFGYAVRILDFLNYIQQVDKEFEHKSK